MTPWLLLWLQICCTAHGVDPAFALSVAQIESGTRTQEVRLGPIGKGLAGPFGLHRAYCREHFGVDPVVPEVNIAIGVRALRGKDKVQVLKRFNPEWRKDRYLACVMAKMRELEEQP